MVQQSAGLVGPPRAPGAAAVTAGRPALTVAPAGTAAERAADAAADALVSGRPFVFSGAGTAARADQPPVLQRYMAWEHSLLGDLDPARVAGDGGGRSRARLRLPRPARRARGNAAAGGPGAAARRASRARHGAAARQRAGGDARGAERAARLPGAPGRDRDRPARVPRTADPVGAELEHRGAWPACRAARVAPGPLPRLLPGSLRYPLLGPLAESAEIAAVTSLGKRPRVRARQPVRLGPGPQRRPLRPVLLVPLALVPPAGPLPDRALRDRERRRTGRPCGDARGSARATPTTSCRTRSPPGTLSTRPCSSSGTSSGWPRRGVSYPGRDVLDTLTVARQPLLHGPGHYDRAAARLGDMTGRTGPARCRGRPGIRRTWPTRRPRPTGSRSAA